MYKIQNILKWMVPAAVVFLGGCMNNGTEIPNGAAHVVSGRLVDGNNQPVAGASVHLIAANYVPSLTAAKTASVSPVTTDANGNYQITLSDTGVYNIDCKKDTLGAFIDSVEISSTVTTVQVPDHFMKRLGTIKGISHMPGQNDTNQVRVTLYIPGTGRITKPVIGGAFTFEDVPEGSYQIIIDPTLNGYDVKILNAVVLAGATTDLDTVGLPVHQPNTLQIDALSDYFNFFKINAISIKGDTIVDHLQGTSAGASDRVIVLKGQYDLTAQLPAYILDSITGESPYTLAFYTVPTEPKTYSCSLDNLGKQFAPYTNSSDSSAVYMTYFNGTTHPAYFRLKSVTQTVTPISCTYYAGKGFTFPVSFYFPPYGKITVQYQ